MVYERNRPRIDNERIFPDCDRVDCEYIEFV